ncbi:hypothetical protein ACH4A8_28700 [Streptomyces vietnamensis]|uniref:hypothetical protein n=1 Tax=Streptomyces vietnamensis TaxID=362257 RepID=UPI00379F3937
MPDATPAGVDLLPCLSRLELRFDSSASLAASDAHDDPATLEWDCRAVLPLREPDDEEAVVQRTWQSLGFTPFREDVWVMQSHTRDHDDAVERLESAFAQHL